MSLRHPTEYRFRHYRGGRLIWASSLGDVDVDRDSPDHLELVESQLWTPNELVNQGEQDILQVFFRAATPPTEFYLGLCNDTIVDTDALTDLALEPSTNGYARQLVERSATGFPTSSLDGGDWRVKTGTETFAATGGSWGPVNTLFLATTVNNSGRLIATSALSTPRTLQDGDTLDTDLQVKLA